MLIRHNIVDVDEHDVDSPRTATEPIMARAFARGESLLCGDMQFLNRPPYTYHWEQVPHRCCPVDVDLRGHVKGGTAAYDIQVYSVSPN